MIWDLAGASAHSPLWLTLSLSEPAMVGMRPVAEDVHGEAAYNSKESHSKHVHALNSTDFVLSRLLEPVESIFVPQYTPRLVVWLYLSCRRVRQRLDGRPSTGLMAAK